MTSDEVVERIEKADAEMAAKKASKTAKPKKQGQSTARTYTGAGHGCTL